MSDGLPGRLTMPAAAGSPTVKAGDGRRQVRKEIKDD